MKETVQHITFKNHSIASATAAVFYLSTSRFSRSRA